jgi:hypothetical protein
MQRQPVIGSTSLRSAGYDPKAKTLEIEFTTGVYEYTGVPDYVYQDLMDAESKGEFVAEFIKGRYPFKRV